MSYGGGVEEGRLAWLVLRAQAGDRAALEELLRGLSRLLRSYVMRMVTDEDVAEDALQEVLILIYRKLSTLREPRAVVGWARRIASRVVMRMLRSMSSEEKRSEPVSENLADELAEPTSQELITELPALLSRVSPASREVLVLHFLEGLPLIQVAAVLDIPLGTAKSRLGYGLSTLRRLAAGRDA